jgi:hypothetical protein
VGRNPAHRPRRSQAGGPAPVRGPRPTPGPAGHAAQTGAPPAPAARIERGWRRDCRGCHGGRGADDGATRARACQGQYMGQLLGGRGSPALEIGRGRAARRLLRRRRCCGGRRHPATRWGGRGGSGAANAEERRVRRHPAVTLTVEGAVAATAARNSGDGGDSSGSTLDKKQREDEGVPMLYRIAQGHGARGSPTAASRGGSWSIGAARVGQWRRGKMDGEATHG